MASPFTGQISVSGFKKGSVDYRYLYIPNFYDSSKQANLKKFYQTMKSRFNRILFVKFEPLAIIEYKRYTSESDRQSFLEEAADYLFKLIYRTYRRILNDMIEDRGGYVRDNEIYVPPLNVIGMNEGGCLAINLMHAFNTYGSTLKIDKLFVQTITLPDLLKNTDKPVLSNMYFIVHNGYEKFLSKNPKSKVKFDEFLRVLNTYTETLHIMYTNEIEINVEYLQEVFGGMAGACIEEN